MPEPPVNTKGLRELRRDLRALDLALPREFNREAREAAVPIARRAQSLWNSRPGPRTGRGRHILVRPFSSGSGFGIRSNHPGANWLQWGGVINPRGVDIVRSRASPGALFAWRAATEGADAFVDEFANRVDALADRHGWNRRGV